MTDSTPLSKSRSAFVSELTESLDSTSEPLIAHITASLPTVTPLTAYAALAAQSEYGFLLESAEKTPSSDPDGAFAPDYATADRHARFSFVGYDPDAVITVSPDEVESKHLGDAQRSISQPTMIIIVAVMCLIISVQQCRNSLVSGFQMMTDIGFAVDLLDFLRMRQCMISG
jgi:anthranilate synthase, component I (EC 4.1.3.27)